MGKKKVSLQTIADALGISKYAVSLALNNKPGVSDELRQKVFETAREMKYEKSKRRTSVKNLNIIVIIPEYIRMDIYFYSVIYWAIEKCIQSKGHTAILTSVSKEMERDLVLPGYLTELDIAGVLVVGVLSEAYIKKIQNTKLPLVSVDQYYDAVNIDSVGTANEEGAYQMVEYLINKGHSDIGFVGSIDTTSSIYERWCGYMKAMSAHKLNIIKEHCILDTSPLESLFSMPDELEGYVDKMASFPTAWFCAGDRMAISLINVLKQRGIRVPEDVSVVGFDNQELSWTNVPALTTYNVKRTEMGKLAVERILEKIESPLGHTMRVTIHGEVIVRDSVEKLL